MAATEVKGSRHIVDELIEERAPTLFRNPLTRQIMRVVLYPLLGYREAVASIDRVAAMPGGEILSFAARELAIETRTLGLSRLPRSGRVLIAPNHPTGLADGIALWQALRRVREDVRILANSDAIRVADGLKDVIIPVEWDKAKRSPAGSRRILAHVAGAIRAENAVVLFASGRLAYMHWRGLRERPWMPTVATLARKFEAPILPLHIRARNSALFYLLSQVSAELRDVTLFHELLNKRGRVFELTLGPLIDPWDLPEDPQEAAARLQRFVEHELPRASGPHPCIDPVRRRLPQLGLPT